MRLTAAFVVFLAIAAIQLQAVQADLEMVEARGPFGTTAQRVNWGPNNCLTNGGNSGRTLIWMDLKGCNGARIQVDARGQVYWQRLIDIMDEWHWDPPAAVTGAYNCRLITNGNDLSLHAYGIAADFWWDINPYGPTLITNMPRGMVDEIKAIRTVAGDRVFGWGGDYSSNKDAMHYEFVASPAELARGIAPRTCMAGVIPGMCVHNSRCSGGVASTFCPTGAPSIVCCPLAPPTPPNPPIARGEDPCAARGGTCRTSGCTSEVASGLCPGSSANRCCLDGTGQGAGTGSGGSAGTFTPPPPRTCTAGGVSGVCMHESRCTGTKTGGLCPGSSAIKCCTGGNGVPATCSAVTPGSPIPQVPPINPPETPPTPNIPPVPTVENGVGTPCTVNGVSGLCMAVADCVGTITANKCPGSSNVKCCTPFSGNGGGNTPPSGGGSTNGVGQACTANGIAGTCKLTSDCTGTKTPGLCPGPSNVQCCTSGGGPNNGGPPGGSGTGDAQHIGKPCTANGVGGTCQNVNVCTGKSTAGLCPGSSQIQCCTANNGNGGGGTNPNPPGGNTNPPSGGPSCSANGISGTCSDRNLCTGDVSNNLCNGGANTKCCTAFQLVTTAGRGTDVVCSIQPKVRIDVTTLSGEDKAMAVIFNSKGSFLYKAAAVLGCRPGPLAATLYKESRGDGFGPDGRMTVRLENHVLFREHTNSGALAARVAQFDTLFAPHTGTANHVYTNTPGGAKVSFHGNQGKEWDALGTAQTRLSDTAAIRSHSMGVAQIMGFNWQSTGFSSPQDMFRKMSGSLEEQLNAYVKFIQNAPACLRAIRASPPDYRGFAQCYNGDPNYGDGMKTAADAYDRVTPNICGNSLGEVGRCVAASACGSGNTQQTGLCSGSAVCCMPIARPAFTPIASPGSCTDSNGKNGLCMDASQCPGTVYSGRPGCASFASNIKCCVASQALPVTYGPCVTSGGVAGRCTAGQSCVGTFDAGNCPSNTPFGTTLKCCPQVCAPAVITSSFLEEAAEFTPRHSKLQKLADRVHRSRQPENALTPMQEEESM